MLSPMMSTGPSDSAETAHALVSWSTTTIVTIATAIQTGRARRREVVSLSAPFATSLALHALLGPRQHLEPADRDAVTARDAYAEGTQRDALQRAFDLVD